MDDRRKKLRFRSWHRGMKEVDLILGRFADAHLPKMSNEELDQFEDLLACSDQSLYGWFNGKNSLPQKYDNDVMRLLMNFEFKVEQS